MLNIFPHHIKNQIMKFRPRIIQSAFLAILYTTPNICASNGDINYDAQLQQKNKIYEQFISRTYSCMNSFSKIKLMQGIRDSDEIIEYTKKSCGLALSNFIDENIGISEAERDKIIHELAFNALRDVPGVNINSATSKDTQSNQKITNYLIITKKNGSITTTRKTDSEEILNTANYLADTFKISHPPKNKLLLAANSMHEKDRCFNLSISTVAAAAIESGIMKVTNASNSFFNISIDTIKQANKKDGIECEIRQI